MDIDRNVSQHNSAAERVEFCLDVLEDADDFRDGIGWGTHIVDDLTVEEIIGALVASGQDITNAEERTRLDDGGD